MIIKKGFKAVTTVWVGYDWVQGKAGVWDSPCFVFNCRHGYDHHDDRDDDEDDDHDEHDNYDDYDEHAGNDGQLVDWWSSGW